MTPCLKDQSLAGAVETERSANVARHLAAMAATVPEHPALIVTTARDRDGRARYAQLSFQQLESLSNRYANGLIADGFRRGLRVLLMVRPGVEFVGLVFALFKVRAVPVLIDPGMGVGRMLECIRHVRPQAMIGIPPAHAVRVLRRSAFRDLERVVTVGRKWFWGGPTLESLSRRAKDEPVLSDTPAHETAAILFTSGSTGPAKGVVYEHGMFDAQVEAIRDHYGMAPGELDLPTFPLFALFNPALGITSVIPDMDPAHPARVDPARIVEAIRDHRITNSFGSPALWERVSRYCDVQRIKLHSLRRVLIAGAPVPWTLVERMRGVLNGTAEVHTPYGATEALPVASITGAEIIGRCAARTRQGAGICVGRPLPGMEVRIIRITDGPIERWSPELALGANVIGEIAVLGPVVTKEYFGLPQANANAKMLDADDTADGSRPAVWHRMGDVGYLDDAGRLWFCGRKAHRVVMGDQTLFTIPSEAIFNEHPLVRRSALVGIGDRGMQRPAMVIESADGTLPRGREAAGLRAELLKLGQAHPLTRTITDIRFHHGFPVDVRHNAKIDREALARWATEHRP